MPTEELEQALLRAKWDSAEADATEVIARLLDLPREAVVRVNYAFRAAASMRLGSTNPGDDEIDEDVRTAMKAQIRRGLLRMRVREAIRDERMMFVNVGALIDAPVDVCRGCPFSLECVTASFSTPDKCYKSGPPQRVFQRADNGVFQVDRFSRGGTAAHPLRIKGDEVTVECTHPRGTYVVDVEALWP
jgi:hypothetical protein